MAEAKRPVRERLITPKGVAVYPRLTTPDTKFNPEGVYSLRLRMSEEEAADMMADLDARAQASFDKAVADNGGKTFKLVKGKKVELEKNDPYVRVLDEDGESFTGEIEFSFSMKATYKDKDGKVHKRNPGLADGKGKALKKPPNIYGGSIVKVNYTPGEYQINTASGVKLYLNAVQIIKLVSGGGGAMGFGADEDAEYSYEEDDDSSGFGDDDSSSTDDQDDDDQF
jgi:hypothetical protein